MQGSSAIPRSALCGCGSGNFVQRMLAGRKSLRFSDLADAESLDDDSWADPFGGAKMPVPK